MTDTPNDDSPGFVATAPEHCYACYRLICPGQTYYLTIDNAILCGECVRDTDAIRVADDLVVVVEDDKLLVRRGSATVEVLPREVRHLGDALAESSLSAVERRTRTKEMAGLTAYSPSVINRPTAPRNASK